ncbi:hypothetical protein UlMin_027377 [Ulmus minor]
MKLWIPCIRLDAPTIHNIIFPRYRGFEAQCISLIDKSKDTNYRYELIKRGNNCGVEFESINEGYDIVMSNLRGMDESSPLEMYEKYGKGIDEPMRWMNDPDWDMWEEWMGWEGAGIRDYTSHINPYI